MYKNGNKGNVLSSTLCVHLTKVWWQSECLNPCISWNRSWLLFAASKLNVYVHSIIFTNNFTFFYMYVMWNAIDVTNLTWCSIQNVSVSIYTFFREHTNGPLNSVYFKVHTSFKTASQTLHTEYSIYIIYIIIKEKGSNNIEFGNFGREG